MERDLKDEKYLNEIRDILKEYSSGNRIPTWDQTIEECDTVVIRSILGAFGLSFFADQVGGHVTTIHNFKKGITANDADMMKALKFQKGYDNKEIRPQWASYQKDLRDWILKDSERSKVPLISGYTGKDLPLDGRAQLEHIVSISEIYSDPKSQLAFDLEGIKKLVYADSNLTMIESEINQSKGDLPLKEWLEKRRKDNPEITNAEYFGIDIGKAVAADEAARKILKKEQQRALLKKQGSEIIKEGVQQGVIMGAREVLAVILIDFYEAAVPRMRSIVQSHKSGDLTLEMTFDEIKSAFIEIKDRVIADWEELIKIFFTGVESGVVSTLITFAVNCVLTTSKCAVVIIRESVFAVIRAIQIKYNGMLTDEEREEAIKDLLISTATICLTALLGEAIHSLICELPFSSELSQAIAAILVGLTIVLITYSVVSMQEELLATTASTAEAALTLKELVEEEKNRNKKAEDRIKWLKDNTDTKNRRK